MFRSNKQQRIEKSPKVVSIRIWLRSVQEDGCVLGKIETKTATTPRAKSRSILQTKLAALEMREHPKDVDVDVILADLPKGEQNINPTEQSVFHQVSLFWVVKLHEDVLCGQSGGIYAF